MSRIRPLGRQPSRSPFDEIRRTDEGADGVEFEYWSAREAMSHLGYTDWRNVENVIRKARSACRNAGHDPGDHFVDVDRMVSLGSGSERRITDVQMTRFGMYLLAMNGDPDKPEIATAQRYFAVQTYRAEQLLPPITPPPTPPPVAPAPTQLPRPWAERFRETFMPHVRELFQHHPGCFTVVSAAVNQILVIEDELLRHLMETREFDRPDISIGLRYATHRRGLGLSDPTRCTCLYLPQQGISVEVRVYEGSEWPTFTTWFHGEYLPRGLPAYFDRKPELERYGRLTRASAADHACRGLSGRDAELPSRVRTQLAAAGGFAPARQLPPGDPRSRPQLPPN